jgi:hypothetical protein
MYLAFPRTDAIVLIASTLLSPRQLIVRMHVDSISHSEDTHQLLLDALAHSSNI